MSVAVQLDPNVTSLQAIYVTALQLYEVYGVCVTWSRTLLDLVEFDGHTRTVTLAADTPIEAQAWALSQIWVLCVSGLEAVPAAEPQRHLSLV